MRGKSNHWLEAFNQGDEVCEDCWGRGGPNHPVTMPDHWASCSAGGGKAGSPLTLSKTARPRETVVYQADPTASEKAAEINQRNNFFKLIRGLWVWVALQDHETN